MANEHGRRRKDGEIDWEGCALPSKHVRCFCDLLMVAFLAENENSARERGGN